MKIFGLIGLSVFIVGGLGCEEHTLADEVTFTESITRVDIQLDSSDVHVIGVQDDGAFVEYDIRYRGSEPSITTAIEGDTLRVRMKCKLSCDGGFVVKVPRSVTGVIQLDSGDMEVSDLEGDTRIGVDSGNIHLNGLSGVLTLTADSGNIKGSVLSTVVDGSVDSGNLDLRFDNTPTDLDFTADSGNISLKVPKGAYDVHTQVDSGTTRVNDITVDSDASSVIYADVDSGNITIQGY